MSQKVFYVAKNACTVSICVVLSLSVAIIGLDKSFETNVIKIKIRHIWLKKTLKMRLKMPCA